MTGAARLTPRHATRSITSIAITTTGSVTDALPGTTVFVPRSPPTDTRIETHQREKNGHPATNTSAAAKAHAMRAATPSRFTASHSRRQGPRANGDSYEQDREHHFMRRLQERASTVGEHGDRSDPKDVRS